MTLGEGPPSGHRPPPTELAMGEAEREEVRMWDRDALVEETHGRGGVPREEVRDPGEMEHVAAAGCHGFRIGLFGLGQELGVAQVACQEAIDCLRPAVQQTGDGPMSQ